MHQRRKLHFYGQFTVSFMKVFLETAFRRNQPEARNMLTRAFDSDSNHKALIKTSGRNYNFPWNYRTFWFPVAEDKGEINRPWDEKAGLFMWSWRNGQMQRPAPLDRWNCTSVNRSSEMPCKFFRIGNFWRLLGSWAAIIKKQLSILNPIMAYAKYVVFHFVSMWSII